MSDFKFSDSSSEYVEQPDLAQHSDFHFKDKDIEEQVQAEKQRRQAELEAEMARPAVPKAEPEDDFTFIDTPISMSGEAKPRSPKVEPPTSQAPAAPAGLARPGGVQPPQGVAPQNDSSQGAAPARKPAAPVPSPRVPSPKIPGAAPPAGAAPRAPSPKVPSPHIPSPQVGVPVAAARTPRPKNAGTSAGAQGSGVGNDVAANLKHAIEGTNAEVDPVISDETTPVWRQALSKIDPLVNAILLLSVIGVVVSLAYILWGVFSGAVGQPVADGIRANQIAQNIQLASKILSFSLFSGALALVFSLFDEGWFGPVLAVVGFSMHFGAVPVLGSIGQTEPVLILIQATRGIGYSLVVIGLLKYCVDVARWLLDLPNRMRLRANVGIATRAEAAQQRIAANANMFSPCWQLPFCREVIRKQCPAYIARKRCWKFGRGCYCDEEMISRIVRGESEEAVKAPTRMSRQGKPPCGRCYIFLEHQNLKFKVLSPLAVPVTVIGMVAIWGQMMNAMNFAGQGLQGVWTRLSFAAVTATTTSTPEAIDAYKLSAQEVQHVAQTMFGVIFGFFALIYISKFLEWAIYKAKW